MLTKNILVTATTFPRWKNDTEPDFVFVLSKLLANYGHKVAVLAPHFHKAEKYEVIGNLKIYRFPYFFPYNLQKLCYEGGIFGNIKRYKIALFQLPLLFFFEFLNMVKLIRKEKIDIIHAHWILPQGFLAYLCKKLFAVKYIVTAHAGDVFPLKNQFFRFFSYLALKNCDYCTANSNFTKKELKKISNKTVVKVPMGVNLSAFTQKKYSKNLKKKFGIKKELILAVGRLVEKKGIKYLIKAMVEVTKNLPEAKAIIIGDGPERKRLELLARKLRLHNNILFIGSIEKKYLPEFYATADIFVGPSIVTDQGDTEGLGIVFLEALASCTCAIGSKVGGIPDVIKHNKTGLLVRQKEPKQLAEAILKLLSNRKLRKKLALMGREHVKKTYSWDLVGNKFNDIILSIK